MGQCHFEGGLQEQKLYLKDVRRRDYNRKERKGLLAIQQALCILPFSGYFGFEDKDIRNTLSLANQLGYLVDWDIAFFWNFGLPFSFYLNYNWVSYFWAYFRVYFF